MNYQRFEEILRVIRAERNDLWEMAKDFLRIHTGDEGLILPEDREQWNHLTKCVCGLGDVIRDMEQILENGESVRCGHHV